MLPSNSKWRRARMSTETTLDGPPPGAKSLPRASLRKFVPPLWKLFTTGSFDGVSKALDGAGEAFFARSPFGRFVVMNDPALIEEVLVTNHKDYHKDPGYAALKRLMGDGL